MTKIFSRYLLLFSLLTSVSCEKCDPCEIIYLADMICKELSTAVPSVPTGVAFTITTIVKNVAESSELCETDVAGESDTQYTVQYRSTEDMPWEETPFDYNDNLVDKAFVATDPLGADAETGFEPKFSVNNPGQYRFEGNADGLLAVDERNESNNGGNAEGSQTGKLAEPANVVIITVVAALDYQPTGEKPVVTYLGYTKLF